MHRRVKVAVGTILFAILGAGWLINFGLEPENQSQYVCPDGTVIRLLGTTFGTNDQFRITTRWQRAVEMVASIAQRFRSRPSPPPGFTSTTPSGQRLGQIVTKPMQLPDNFHCHLEIANLPAGSVWNRAYLRRAEAVDSGGCVYLGRILPARKQGTQLSMVIRFAGFPAHQEEFDLRVSSVLQTNPIVFPIKNLAFKKVQSDLMPTTRGDCTLTRLELLTNCSGQPELRPAIRLNSKVASNCRLKAAEIYSAYQPGPGIYPPCPHEPVWHIRAGMVTNLLWLDEIALPAGGEVIDLSARAIQADLGLSRLALAGPGGYELSNGIVVRTFPQMRSPREFAAKPPAQGIVRLWSDGTPHLLFSTDDSTADTLQIAVYYVDELVRPRCAKTKLKTADRAMDVARTKCFSLAISGTEVRTVEFCVANPLKTR